MTYFSVRDQLQDYDSNQKDLKETQILVLKILLYIMPTLIKYIIKYVQIVIYCVFSFSLILSLKMMDVI